MLRPLFPLRKIRRNGAYLLFGAVLVVAAFTAYLEFVATNALGSDGKFIPSLHFPEQRSSLTRALRWHNFVRIV